MGLKQSIKFHMRLGVRRGPLSCNTHKRRTLRSCSSLPAIRFPYRRAIPASPVGLEPDIEVRFGYYASP